MRDLVERDGLGRGVVAGDTVDVEDAVHAGHAGAHERGADAQLHSLPGAQLLLGQPHNGGGELPCVFWPGPRGQEVAAG